ncbi:hypothetical protein EJ05DRAFT_186718 [Pseudovirgaria hyperparasitica]|uniref:Uncharacterized protein n=1 Tax=Pseudovirgaria hyperparasitica TaxID=470096 RepID=A0A6A6WGB6_9PEZI|nr:uncharacterized protein EJ05DRAFT_186718 [Pseudovirgaria hyperparasitica]KAF2761848.1 hypothetical protein EJ05DRAFT_186718 [Pseudovirgaria hyperparasitica]
MEVVMVTLHYAYVTGIMSADSAALLCLGLLYRLVLNRSCRICFLVPVWDFFFETRSSWYNWLVHGARPLTEEYIRSGLSMYLVLALSSLYLKNYNLSSLLYDSLC